ncbi:MAG: bis(5'-nucleosyl)-tetraphosphatase (symmetrical) YqeK [Ruthenibacterium lactatiformans]
MGPQKIILFGGTFDPPHNGHMTLLAGAIEAVRLDLVLVEPAGTPPHKRAGGTSAAHRLAMCECFRPLFPELVLDTTEIARGGKSYTIDTVRQMNVRYPGAQLYFPMGSDMLLWFRNWAAYRELLRRVVLVAHLRTGEDAAPVREYAAGLAAEGGTVLFAKAPVFPVSSTEVRALAAKGRPLDGLVPESVAAYIARHHLYTPAVGEPDAPGCRTLKRTLRPGCCGRESGDLILISVDEAKRLAKKNLSPKRYEHTCNVRKLAVKLAKAHGADEKKAALAALLHDIAKELPRDRLLQIFTENAIIAGNAAQRPAPVWHGAAAAILAQTQYGVDDGEILSAIRCHTTGRPGMTKLDKIIYLADMASYERTYPEAEQLRRHALADLDRTAIEGLGLSIAWLKAGGKPVDEESLLAYADLRARYYGGRTSEQTAGEP